MSTQEKEVPLLEQEATARLTDFARACKSAARAVTLYPSSHPAIGLSLTRLVEATSRMTAAGSVQLGIVPDNLLLDGAAPARPDQAVRETGALLHDHMIGVVTLHSSADAAGWLPFLQLLAKPPDETRASGGVAHLWEATGQRHLDLREIDYADILRERDGEAGADWADLVRVCLNINTPLDEETLRRLLEMVGDPEQFEEFVKALEEDLESAMGSKASALLRMLRGVLDLVSKTDPSKLEPLLRNMAKGFGTLSPELLLELLSPEKARADGAADLILQIASRMTEETLGQFVATRVIAQGGATTRLAQAFQALVPDADRRPPLLDIARKQVAQSPLGEGDEFLELWKRTTDMLMSYTDAAWVTESYARELSVARTQAIEVERVSDDPPERISGWVTSVGAAEIRALDLRLLLDLLAIEEDSERWAQVTGPVVAHIDDLLLVGDVGSALRLTEILAREARQDGPRKPHAAAALARLVDESMMTHVVSHLHSADAETVDQLNSLCYTVGPSVIKGLAEVLSVEKRATTRQRLTQLLLGFGAAGRPAVEQLRGSPNSAVRRTAIHLLSEFGGTDALSDLSALIVDSDPQVQREAVRAILSIGTEKAYATLQRALSTSADETRITLMAALISLQSERAIPLFEFIVRHLDRKGPLRGLYLRAIESLGALKAERSIDLLKDALYGGEWWAPRRTAEQRRTAADALRQIGTEKALGVLRDAALHGSRGVRAAAREGR